MNYSRAAIPLLASPQGVAASSIRYCEATEAAAAGVVFLLVFDRKTTPASRSAEASRYFVTRSATPPCGDAKEGNMLDSNLFNDRPGFFVQSPPYGALHRKSRMTTVAAVYDR